MKTLRDIAIQAGYAKLDMHKLLTDFHAQPGCENVSERMLYNYLAGKTSPRGEIAIGLSVTLKTSLESILRGGAEINPQSFR